jgi:hypothetical protein
VSEQFQLVAPNPRVFVTQIPSRYEDMSKISARLNSDAYRRWVPTVDISSAREFGTVIVMLPMGLNFPHADLIVPQIESMINGFTIHDALLPLGDPLLMACAIGMVARKMNKFKILKWDRQQKRYFAHFITL